jgi:hypothetical protein
MAQVVEHLHLNLSTTKTKTTGTDEVKFQKTEGFYMAE